MQLFFLVIMVDSNAQLPDLWPDQKSPVGIPEPVYSNQIFENYFFLILIVSNMIGGNLFIVIRSN